MGWISICIGHLGTWLYTGIEGQSKCIVKIIMKFFIWGPLNLFFIIMEVFLLCPLYGVSIKRNFTVFMQLIIHVL